MLTYDDTAFGIQECILNLRELYLAEDERCEFLDRFDEFSKSDIYNPRIYSLKDYTLKYYSEVFISDNIDKRPPLLLLLGNPASHSVASGICFAFEKGGKEHRFWRILDETGIITFNERIPNIEDTSKKNEMRRNALQELNYLSPFRVGIAVFYSLPSSSSDPKWSGVRGIRKLLGSKAFNVISQFEEKRILKLVSRFIGSTGGIISFQKDAYNHVRSPETPEHKLTLAFQGQLRGKAKSNQNIFLAGSPPTRMIQTLRGKSALREYINWLSQDLQI